MDRALSLVGKFSNEIYLLRYPSALLDFCGYDLSYFAKNAVDACSEAQKTGEIDFDRFTELRREIQKAHVYIAHHIRTTYEKVVLDCYIDYLCRRDSCSTGALWNRFISCRTNFEKTMFARLCELRYNRAINEWLNILRVQDYAKNKVEFVFTKNVKNAAQAAARRSYFDLMFSVTASEMGCRLENLGEVKVFSVGRIPTSPFMFPSISKDIVRHLLADFDYSDDYSDITNYDEISDEIAMDAFSRMKAGLQGELSSYNIVRSKMENYSGKIYMPCSLKAVVDLEIDAVIDSGGVLARCLRCGKMYYRGPDYDEDYCYYLQNGKSCLDIFNEENPPVRMTAELEEKARQVTNEVYSRVGESMSVKEYEYWYSYMDAMKEKVNTGEITPQELDDFLSYSLEVDISRSKPIVEVPKEPHPLFQPRERVVKPFVPERIDRAALKAPAPALLDEQQTADGENEFEGNDASASMPKDGFFVSPTVARRKNEREISHIIRAGESRGGSEKPDPSGFTPLFSDNNGEERVVKKRKEKFIVNIPEEAYESDTLPEKTADESPAKARKSENRRGNGTIRDNSAQYEIFTGDDFGKSVVKDFGHSEIEKEENEAPAKTEKPPQILRETREDNVFAAEERNEAEPKPKPKPKVIRKNAAAISAYGKIAGTAEFRTELPREEKPEKEAPQAEFSEQKGFEKESFEDISDVREEFEDTGRGYIPEHDAYSEEKTVEKEPYKDIGSIFDVLENSSEGQRSSRSRARSSRGREISRAVESAATTVETDEPEEISAPVRKTSGISQRVRDAENSREPSREKVRETPSRVTKENAPSGVWTEDRGLFPQNGESFDDADDEDVSELDMLKEKRQHAKSNKTKRLYDVIMRQPDDNPNFRRR